MPEIITPSPIQDMLHHQQMWGLSDSEFGKAILGNVRDAAKTVRTWKDGSEPTPPAVQSFLRLKALVRICNNSPLSDAEENYAIAHNALPDCLK